MHYWGGGALKNVECIAFGTKAPPIMYTFAPSIDKSTVCVCFTQATREITHEAITTQLEDNLHSTCN